ncbi:MAG: gamma-glutamylcyclotransferase family protein [bacterium]
MHYYFAYGSNMNIERMRARDLNPLRAMPARLPGFALAFNKRSRFFNDESRANIMFNRNDLVEGVVYELPSANEIAKLDFFEGTPRYYSREIMVLDVNGERLGAWTYIANPAAIADGLLPPRWYVNHLLKGQCYLTDAYLDRLHQVSCMEERSDEPC